MALNQNVKAIKENFSAFEKGKRRHYFKAAA